MRDTRYKHSLELFQEYGLVLKEDETIAQSAERRQKLATLELETNQGELENYFPRKVFLEMMLKSDNDKTKINDGTEELRRIMKYFLDIPHLILPVKAAEIHHKSILPTGLCGLADNNSSIPFIKIEYNQNEKIWSTEEFLENLLLEEYDTNIISKNNFWADATPEIIKYLKPYFENEQHNLEYNIICSLFLDKIKTQLHEGIHAIYFINKDMDTVKGTEDHIIIESGALKLSSDIYIDKILDKINSEHDLYDEKRLKEIKKEIFELNSLTTEYILKTTSTYNPYIKKKTPKKPNRTDKQFLEFNADNLILARDRKDAEEYAQNVHEYVSALNNLTLKLLEKNMPLSLAIHEALKFDFEPFLRIYGTKAN